MSLLLASKAVAAFFIPSTVDLATAESPATVELSFLLDGSIGGTDVGAWYNGSSTVIGNDFEIKAVEVGGPAGFTGTFGAYLPITETRLWSLQQSGVGTKSGEIEFSLRRIGDTIDVLVVNTVFNVEVTA